MKRISSFLISVLCAATALAQSTNPLNYSGKMFVSSYEILSTPRYVSYEDHGILNSELTIPVTEITTLISDFENGTLKSGETEYTQAGMAIIDHSTGKVVGVMGGLGSSSNASGTLISFSRWYSETTYVFNK